MHRSILLFLVLSSSLHTNSLLIQFKASVAKNDFDNAFRILEDHLESNNKESKENSNKLFSYYYFHRSLYEWKSGNLKIASINMDLALQNRPENIDLQKARAQLYLDSNQLDEAKQLIETFISKVNVNDRRNFNLKLARLLIKKEMLFEAVQTLQNHQIEFPKHLQALEELASLYMKLEQYQEAADIYKNLIDLNSSTKFREGLRKAKHGLEVSQRTVHSYSASFKIRIEGEHFEKHYPVIFEELENCSSKLNRIFSYEPRGLVNILFLNNVDFKKWNHLSNYVQGLSDGNSWQIRIPINRIQNFENKTLLINTIHHEYTHHLVRLITKGKGEIPTWFQEGLAKFFEPNRDYNNERALLRKLINKNLLFKAGQIPSYFGMHSKSYEAYIQSVSMIDFLESRRCLSHLIMSLSEFTEGTKFSDKLLEQCVMNEYQLTNQWKKWVYKKVMEKDSEY